MLYLDTRRQWAVSITPLVLHLQESTLDTHWTWGWMAPDPFWNSVKITLFPAWERISDFSTHGLATIPCIVSRLLTRIYILKTAEVTGDWIKLYNNKFQNSYFSLSIIRTIISRYWMKNEEYVWREKYTKFISGNLEVRNCLRDTMWQNNNIKFYLKAVGFESGSRGRRIWFWATFL